MFINRTLYDITIAISVNDNAILNYFDELAGGMCKNLLDADQLIVAVRRDCVSGNVRHCAQICAELTDAHPDVTG